MTDTKTEAHALHLDALRLHGLIEAGHLAAHAADMAEDEEARDRAFNALMACFETAKALALEIAGRADEMEGSGPGGVPLTVVA